MEPIGKSEQTINDKSDRLLWPVDQGVSFMLQDENEVTATRTQSLSCSEVDTTPSTSSSSPTRIWLDHFLFFMAGLGSSIGYISSLSSLVYFQQCFGNNFFVILNLAVYVPLVPIAVAQCIWDQHYDLDYATHRTFVVRALVGYGLVILGTIGMIFVMIATSLSSLSREMWVIFCACLQGTGGAILYGQLNQLASFVTTNDTITSRPLNGYEEEDDDLSVSQSFKATVSAGGQASALVVLVLSWSSGFGTMNGARYPAFLWSVVAFLFICFGSFLWLLLQRPRIRVSMIRRDSSLRLSRHSISLQDGDLWDNADGTQDTSSSLQHPLLTLSEKDLRSPPSFNTSLLPSTTTLTPRNSSNDFSPECVANVESAIPRELSFSELWHSSRTCCGILAITLVPSFLVASWFTRVCTQWMELPQILFYVRIGMDFMGRVATLWTCDCNHGSNATNAVEGSNGAQEVNISNKSNRAMSCILWTSVIRLGFVVGFFVNARRSFAGWGTYQDTISIGLVAVISFSSGYLVTSCYQLSPLQLPVELRKSNVTNQSSLLTVAFAWSALAGLATSFALIALGI